MVHNYNMIANDLLLNTSWEAYPYTGNIEKHSGNDVHFYRNLSEKGGRSEISGEKKIPHHYVRLDIEKKLVELYPNERPNMDTVGYAVVNRIKELKINEYIIAKDKGWESSNFWATLDAVYISKEDYKNKILVKINQIVGGALNLEEESDSEIEAESDSEVDNLDSEEEDDDEEEVEVSKERHGDFIVKT